MWHATAPLARTTAPRETAWKNFSEFIYKGALKKDVLIENMWKFHKQ